MKTKKEKTDLRTEECPMNNLNDRLQTQYPLVYNSLDFSTKREHIPKIFEEYEQAFKLKDMLIKIGHSKEREEYFYVISFDGKNFNSLKETEWCFNFEMTAQMACIENCFEILQERLINSTPMDMAKERLEKERSKNMELWVDGEQTDYWKEIYIMGVEDERKRLTAINQNVSK